MFRFEIGSAGLTSLAAGALLAAALLFLSGLALGSSMVTEARSEAARPPLADTVGEDGPDAAADLADDSSLAAEERRPSRTTPSVSPRTRSLSTSAAAYSAPGARRPWSSLTVRRTRPSLDRLRPGRRATTPILAYRLGQGVPPTPYGRLIYEEARRRQLNPALVAAVVAVESGFNPSAVSPKGAIGLMQVIPDTATRFGIDPRSLKEPGANLIAGTKYLRWLSAHYDGSIGLTLAAYNAGDGAVDRWGGIPPYDETRDYVRKVFSTLNALGQDISG